VADPDCADVNVNTFVVPNVNCELAFVIATVVNRPVDAVVAPMEALFIVPPLTTGDVNVLFVNVSVVARPTIVSVAFGNVSVALPDGTGKLTVVMLDVPNAI
jgi:hypothetical protein